LARSSSTSQRANEYFAAQLLRRPRQEELGLDQVLLEERKPS